MLLPLAGGDSVSLDLKRGFCPSCDLSYVWSPDSSALLFRGGPGYLWSDWDLWRSHASAGGRVGDLEPVTSGWSPRYVTAVGAAGSPLVYTDSSSGGLHIWSLSVDTEKGLVNGTPRRVVTGEHLQGFPSALGANKLAYLSNEGGHQDLWIHNLETGKDTRLTDNPERNAYPV